MSHKKLALVLVVVATVAATGGAYAASIAIGQTNNTGEQGSYHNNSGGITAVDNGLAPVANAVTSNVSTSFAWGATGTNKQIYNTLVAGDLMDYITFSTSLTDGSTHVATVTVRNGSGALGATLKTATSGTWTAPSSTSTATITMYIDLGVQTVTAPVTVYIAVT